MFAMCLLAGLSATALGEASFGGVWDTSLVFEVQTDSSFLRDESATSLRMAYELEDWEFACDASLSMGGGLESVKLSSKGRLGEIKVRSSVDFNPTADVITKSPKANDPTHQLYDFRREYFVVSMEVRNVDCTSDWYVQASLDGVSWDVVGGPFASVVHDSGAVSANLLARYIEVIPTTGSLSVMAAAPEATIEHSKNVFRTSLAYSTADKIRLNANLTVPNVGDGGLKLKFTGPSKSIVRFSSTVNLALHRSSCQLRFDKASMTLTSSFGCIEKLKSVVSFEHDRFDTLKLSVGKIATGLPWLSINTSLQLSTEEMRITASPSVSVGKAGCITLHSKMVKGASPVSVSGIGLSGVAIEYQLGIVSIRSLSYFNRTSRVPMAGGQSCWESLSLSITPESECCGVRSLDVLVGFSHTSPSLFDWAETDLKLAFDLADALSGELSMVLEAVGWTGLSLRLSATW